MQIFKFQRRSYELSFLFPPRRQSTPESLLSGYRNKTNKQKSPQESSIVGVHCFFCDDGTSRKTPKCLVFSRLYGRWSSFQTCDYPELILFIFFIYCISGSGIIWLDGVRCIGFEPSLTLCLNSGWGETNCDPSHGEDAWVICDNSTVKDISNNFCRQVNSGSCADHQVIIQNANSVRAHYIGWLLRRYENHTQRISVDTQERRFRRNFFNKAKLRRVDFESGAPHIGGSKPSDKVDSKMGGGGGCLQKKFFRPSGPQFGLKISGGWAPGPSPGSTTATYRIGSVPHFGAV